jgi:hypothetical protein
MSLESCRNLSNPYLPWRKIASLAGKIGGRSRNSICRRECHPLRPNSIDVSLKIQRIAQNLRTVPIPDRTTAWHVS